MSANKQRRWPHMVRGLLGYVLTLLLTISLAAACLLLLANRLLTDQALHERVSTAAPVIDAQMARLEEAVNELAETYHFAPETVLNILTRDSVVAYGRSMTAWWMGLLGPEPEADAPFPDSEAIEEAVRADELFRENTEDFMRRTIARDEVAYAISVEMQNAVMPIRQSLVSLAAPHLTSRDLPGLINRLAAVPAYLFGAAAVLLILLMLTQGRSRFLYGSVGLLAAFTLLALITALAAAARLPELLTEYSPALALQLGLLQAELLPGILLAEGTLLIGGLLMLVLCMKFAPERSRA